MLPVISIGTQSFEKLRRDRSFYVDKTGLIREWWENQDDVTLITRPRRFGKTLNLNMLHCFFSNQYKNRSDLFEGLAIWEERKYREMQGTWPVIALTFANVKGKTYAGVRDGMIRALFDAFREYDFLFSQNLCGEEANAYYEALKKYTVSASADRFLSDDLIAGALHELSVYLFRYYGKKVLIFLDEYDTPLQEAYVNGFWDELVFLMRSLFNAALKTNPAMERGLLTGITRVSKESIFSDLNNLTVITTTSDRYQTQFGFMEKEVFDALELYGMGGEREKVKRWYDGFTFGSQRDVYNPWSITGFLKERVYKPYWAHSSENSLVNILIREGSAQTKMIVEDLMAGGTFTAWIDEEIIFEQLHKKSGAIWSLLLAGGYLKVENRAFLEEKGRFVYDLKLTNTEVYLLFEDMIKGWFSGEDIPYNAFLRALLLDDVDYMNEYMNQVAGETFSFFDTGNKPSVKNEPERFYHGFVLGLIVELAGEYRVLSNRESGFGRYDVLLEPFDVQKKAYVLEFKVRNPRKEKTLEDTLRAARAQIEEKNYDAGLIAGGIAPEHIRHYGFAFEGKQVLIG